VSRGTLKAAGERYLAVMSMAAWTHGHPGMGLPSP
jgi:hypothetical protein